MRKHSNEEMYAIKLRVNRDLLEELRQLAHRDNRSLNNYFAHLVQQHVASLAPKKKAPK